jgi:hypothetical protein
MLLVISKESTSSEQQFSLNAFVRLPHSFKYIATVTVSVRSCGAVNEDNENQEHITAVTKYKSLISGSGGCDSSSLLAH